MADSVSSGVDKTNNTTSSNTELLIKAILITYQSKSFSRSAILYVINDHEIIKTMWKLHER